MVRYAYYGAVETMDNITLGDVWEFYQHYYRPDLCVLAIVGDIKPDAVFSLVEKLFGNWRARGPLVLPKIAVPPGQVPARRIIRTLPDAREAVAYMGCRGIARNQPGFEAANFANLVLGASNFNGRLMRDLRERQGLVYSITSDWDAEAAAGPWYARFQCSPADVDKAAASVIAEIKELQRDGPTPEELDRIKVWEVGYQDRGMASDASMADWLRFVEEYHLGLNYLWQFPALLAPVTPVQVRDAARRFLFPDHLITSLVSPIATSPIATPPTLAPGR